MSDILLSGQNKGVQTNALFCFYSMRKAVFYVPKKKKQRIGEILCFCAKTDWENDSRFCWEDNGVVTSPDSDTRRGQNNRNNILSISDFFLCVNENFSTVQSIRMEISKHLTECVSAPREIMSTPHSATFRMFSGVTLPDASKSALPFVRRTASFMVS